MKTRIGLCVFLCICLSATCCLAGNMLSIRLIEATSGKSGKVENVLKDVIESLKNILVFKKYRLVASGSLKLPAKNSVCTLSGYKVKCFGKQKNLTITIHKGKKQVLKTNVSLKDDKPLILGGLPSKEGRLILIFLVKK